MRLQFKHPLKLREARPVVSTLAVPFASAVSLSPDPPAAAPAFSLPSTLFAASIRVTYLSWPRRLRPSTLKIPQRKMRFGRFSTGAESAAGASSGSALRVRCFEGFGAGGVGGGVGGNWVASLRSRVYGARPRLFLDPSRFSLREKRARIRSSKAFC